MFAITVGDAIPNPPNPIDTLAFGQAAGLKCIFPFGPSDPQSESTVQVGMPEARIQVEVGPGQPIFIPASTTFARSSSTLVSAGVSGSFVLWTIGFVS